MTDDAKDWLDEIGAFWVPSTYAELRSKDEERFYVATKMPGATAMTDKMRSDIQRLIAEVKRLRTDNPRWIERVKLLESRLSAIEKIASGK